MSLQKYLFLSILFVTIRTSSSGPAPPNLDLWLTHTGPENRGHLERTGKPGRKSEDPSEWIKFRKASECAVCDGLVKGLHWIWSRNATENCVAELISIVCKTLHIEDQPVCASISNEFKFDYIVWTGDLPPHDVWVSTEKEHVGLLSRLTDLFLHFFPSTPVFSAVGNHESSPVDSFPPHSVVPPEFDNDWLYRTLAKEWTHWLPNSTKLYDLIKWRASYAVTIFSGLRLISLNTQYCDRYNFWLYLNQTDPDGTLEWLIKELWTAETLGQKVHIIGHIPSGDPGCLHGWSRNYYTIVNRFENTIRAQFFGHTHKDSFSLFYEGKNATGRATSSQFVGPSLTTFQHVQPGYRIYSIDGNYTNTTWEAYDMDSLFPGDLDKLIDKFIKNESLFDKYLQYYNRHINSECDSQCRYQRLCELRSARSGDPSQCHDLHPQLTYHHSSYNFFAPPNNTSTRQKNHRVKYHQLRNLWQTCQLPWTRRTQSRGSVRVIENRNSSTFLWKFKTVRLVFKKFAYRMSNRLSKIAQSVYDRFWWHSRF